MTQIPGDSTHLLRSSIKRSSESFFWTRTSSCSKAKITFCMRCVTWSGPCTSISDSNSWNSFLYFYNYFELSTFPISAAISYTSTRFRVLSSPWQLRIFNLVIRKQYVNKINYNFPHHVLTFSPPSPLHPGISLVHSEKFNVLCIYQNSIICPVQHSFARQQSPHI